MPTISLCVIVRSEEENLSRCLASACGYADEALVVDAGSGKESRAVCAEYDARILDFKWAGDQAAARSFLAGKASGNWILWLDADEELKMFDYSGLQMYLASVTGDFINIPMVHYYGSAPASDQCACLDSSIRLCRNNASFKFTGRTYGSIANINQGMVVNMPKEFIRILDFAHMENKKNRCIQNINRMIKEKSAPSSDPWLDYDLAVEYWLLKDYQKAYEAVNLAMIGFLSAGLLPPSGAYRLKYDILVRTEDLANIPDGIDKAISLYPHYTDLHFFKGMMEFRYEQYEKAIKTFSYCIILGESSREYLIRVGVGSFLALYYLGLCYEKRQNYPAAAASYRQAVSYYPGYSAARERLCQLDNIQG